MSRHSCLELLNVHEAEIRSMTDDIEDVPLKAKIRRLDKINKLLAHRPWAINRHHIKVLIDLNSIFKNTHLTKRVRQQVQDLAQHFERHITQHLTEQ